MTAPQAETLAVAETAAAWKSRLLIEACSKWSGAQMVEAGDIIEWIADFRMLAAAPTPTASTEGPSDSKFPTGLIKYSDPTTALRYLAKRLRQAGISDAVADDFAESIEFLIARRDDLTNAPPKAEGEAGWEHLKRYGYAPGDYMNKCHACEKVVSFVDKRATTCRPCAEAMHAAPVAQASVGVPALAPGQIESILREWQEKNSTSNWRELVRITVRAALTTPRPEATAQAEQVTMPVKSAEGNRDCGTCLHAGKRGYEQPCKGCGDMGGSAFDKWEPVAPVAGEVKP